MKAKLYRGVPFARTGWQNYLGSELDLPSEGGMVRVFRSDNEVRRSAASFEGVPITVDHPPGLLTADNAGQAAAGIVSAVMFDHQTQQLKADLLIWNVDAIQSVASGIRELSGGYSAEYQPTGPGTYDQTEIKGNHVALVPAGRSGSAQRIGA